MLAPNQREDEALEAEEEEGEVRVVRRRDSRGLYQPVSSFSKLNTMWSLSGQS